MHACTHKHIHAHNHNTLDGRNWTQVHDTTCTHSTCMRYLSQNVHDGWMCAKRADIHEMHAIPPCKGIIDFASRHTVTHPSKTNKSTKKTASLVGRPPVLIAERQTRLFKYIWRKKADLRCFQSTNKCELFLFFVCFCFVWGPCSTHTHTMKRVGKEKEMHSTRHTKCSMCMTDHLFFFFWAFYEGLAGKYLCDHSVTCTGKGIV